MPEFSTILLLLVFFFHGSVPAEMYDFSFFKSPSNAAFNLKLSNHFHWHCYFLPLTSSSAFSLKVFVLVFESNLFGQVSHLFSP